MNVSRRIIVADDEPDMCDYLKRLLPRLGHTVVGIASNGLQLIELCRQLQPDLVITDIRMPELDGLSAAKILHAERPIRVILVSAFALSEIEVDPAECGVVAALVKPITQADLIAAIGRSFETPDSHESLEPRHGTSPRPAEGVCLEPLGGAESFPPALAFDPCENAQSDAREIARPHDSDDPEAGPNRRW